MIEIFKSLTDYNKYFENQLNLSGTILGLIVATSTFILQSGFTSFKYGRSMFLKYYVEQSKFMFLCLAYNIIFSILVLYTNISSNILFFIHIIFALLFTKYVLDFYSHKGFIVTINSSKYNPYKTPIVKYFRYITNLGLIQNFIIYFTIYFVFFYPLHFNEAFNLNKHQIFITTVSCLAFSIIILIRTIPQFFIFSEKEFDNKENNEVKQDLKDVDVQQENEILKQVLIKNGRNELTQQISKDPFKHIFVNMPSNNNEAFFTIDIQFENKNVFEIVDEIKKYSYDFLLELSSIKLDVNTFVLSYFINVGEDEKSRHYFLRTNRNEIEKLQKKYFRYNDFIDNVENKLIDEIFRNL